MNVLRLLLWISKGEKDISGNWLPLAQILAAVTDIITSESHFELEKLMAKKHGGDQFLLPSVYLAFCVCVTHTKNVSLLSYFPLKRLAVVTHKIFTHCSLSSQAESKYDIVKDLGVYNQNLDPKEHWLQTKVKWKRNWPHKKYLDIQNEQFQCKKTKYVLWKVYTSIFTTVFLKSSYCQV